MEYIKRDVIKLIERIKTEDKEHIMNLFDGYMYMVQFIKGDVKWMKKIERSLKKF